jgi:hypothetical protein
MRAGNKAFTILEFIQGLRGTLPVTFEEKILGAWLHDLLGPMSVGWWSAIRPKMR